MPESQLIEYKESWRDEYRKWICGVTELKKIVKKIGKSRVTVIISF